MERAAVSYKSYAVGMLGALGLTAFICLAVGLRFVPPNQVARSSEPAVGQSDRTGRPAPGAVFGGLPLSFEANQGQSGEQVKFVARGLRYALFLTSTEAIMVFGKEEELQGERQTVLRMKFVGAKPDAVVAGQNRLPWKSNYSVGRRATKWHAGIPHYGKVRYKRIYSGIDLVFYGNQQELEYDFLVAPGADPNAISLVFEGANKIVAEAGGNLVVRAGREEIKLRRPVVYQEKDGIKQRIPSGYTFRPKAPVADSGSWLVRFEIGDYDPAKPLVIDPVLSYASYLGGKKADHGSAIAVGPDGSVYVTGTTYSTDFLTGGGLLGAPLKGKTDIFVIKLDATGSVPVYSTYLGGSCRSKWNNEWASGITVDGDGNAYITGSTCSDDFPVTESAHQRVLSGDRDVFVAKLNPSGELLYSTYLGGGCRNKRTTTEYSSGIALDEDGNVYIAGSTLCADFPATPGSVQPVFMGSGRWEADAFVTKLNATGSALVYSTYLGGRNEDMANGIAVDAEGNAHVAGFTDSPDFPTTPEALQTERPGNGDAFVAKLDRTGSALLYSTYLGGSKGDWAFDWADSIAVDGEGSAYVAGRTTSPDFPVTEGAFQTRMNGDDDGFLTKLDPRGSQLAYSTFLPAGIRNGALSVAVDALGQAYIAGSTKSRNFPTTSDALQPARAGSDDAFVMKLNLQGSDLLFSTYLGGRKKDWANGISVNDTGNVYIVGSTSSGDFPTVNALQPARGRAFDAFAAKIGD